MTDVPIGGWFPKSPRTTREAVLGIGLMLSDPLMDPRVMRRCMTVMAETRRERNSLWLAMWGCLLRGIGIAHEQVGSPLLKPSLSIQGSTIGDVPDGAWTGAWWPDGSPFGARDCWGAPEDADDTMLAYAAPEAWVDSEVSVLALAACHGVNEAVFVLERVSTSHIPLEALRHLAWSARQLGVHDSRTMYTIARAVAQSAWATFDDAEAGLRVAVAEA